jgi:hypothetical protein
VIEGICLRDCFSGRQLSTELAASRPHLTIQLRARGLRTTFGRMPRACSNAVWATPTGPWHYPIFRRMELHC